MKLQVLSGERDAGLFPIRSHLVQFIGELRRARSGWDAAKAHLGSGTALRPLFA